MNEQSFRSAQHGCGLNSSVGEGRRPRDRSLEAEMPRSLGLAKLQHQRMNVRKDGQHNLQ